MQQNNQFLSDEFFFESKEKKRIESSKYNIEKEMRRRGKLNGFEIYIIKENI